jgi:fructokinase
MDDTFTIVGLGEALWDMLPGGKQLGGAPLNVACHAQRVLKRRGGRGVVASRVGKDSLGDQVLRELHDRGMPTAYLQHDEQHATGTVHVQLDQGQPTYTITREVAWDHLEFTSEWADLAATCTAVCFGTLAQRSAASRECVWQFLDAARPAIRLFDVNLRQAYYDRESIVEGCRRATIVKLNEEELPIVAEHLELRAGERDGQLAELRTKCRLEAVVLTRGARGTLLVLASETIDPPPASYPAAADADAVGAGDACTAGILAGWVLGLPPPRTAELANHLGAYVASQPGATPELPAEIVGLVGKS